jgi:glucose-6-phosphate 1-dehydrogenase
MHGDAMLFVREDAVEAAGAIVDPILAKETTLDPYEPRSYGLMKRSFAIDGGVWHDPEEREETTAPAPRAA